MRDNVDDRVVNATLVLFVLQHGDGEDSDAGSEASTERVTPALYDPRWSRLTFHMSLNTPVLALCVPAVASD